MGSTGNYKNYCVLRRCTAHDGIGENIYLALGVGLGAEDCYGYNGGKELVTKGYAGAITNGESNFTIHGTTINAFLRRCHSVDGYNGSSACGVEQETGVHSVGAVIDSCLIEQIVATGRPADSQGNGVIWKNTIINYQAGVGAGAEVLYIWNTSDGDQVLHCTLRQTDGSKAIRIGASCSNVHLYNNLQIVDDIANAEQVRMNTGSTAGFLADNNDYHGKDSFYWVAGWYTLANWRVQSGQDANAIASDPTVVDENVDFHLVAGSPCIGAGAVGVGVTYDRDGNPRSSPPSIGAYE